MRPMVRTARRGSRRRASRIGAAALVLAALTLAGCETGLGGSPLLVVATDRTVAVTLRCDATADGCTGTAVVRVGGLDSAPVPYAAAAGEGATVAVTLTDDQYALVPVEGGAPATVRVDQAAPVDRGTTEQAVALRRRGRATTTISMGVDGVAGNHGSAVPTLSRDGRYVAYQSSASNLVAGDANGRIDVFVHDRVTAATTLVSVASDGTQTDAASTLLGISPNGRFVTFTSTATTLVAGVTGTATYVHDRLTRTTRLADPAPPPVPGLPVFVATSRDGRFGVFTSQRADVVPGDTNGYADIFVHDTTTGVTTRVSVTAGGAQAVGGHASTPTISPDGRFVAYSSYATNLVPGDTNASADIFVRDLLTGAVERVSVATGRVQAGSDLRYEYRSTRAPLLSEDGRFVAFQSTHVDLVADDGCCSGDVFVHDRETGETVRASQTTAGAYSGWNGIPGPPAALSGDGRSVAFATNRPELRTHPDPTGSVQIYVHDLDW